VRDLVHAYAPREVAPVARASRQTGHRVISYKR
jgi:hypothetical protein